MLQSKSAGTGPAEERSSARHFGTQAPLRNERGVIAENYSDLQGLGVLARARASLPLPRATLASTARAVYQSIEIGLLNLDDLTTRATRDIVEGSLDRATVKIRWAHGIHRLLVRLSLLAQQLGFGADPNDANVLLRIMESPAYEAYLLAVAAFDKAVLNACSKGLIDVDQVIANESLDSFAYNLLHSARIGNHEAMVWESNLLEVHVPIHTASSYAQFVAPALIREAVYERVLTGDTFFTQFRGLHQIPETLAEEANDHTEHAIRAIRAHRLAEAVDHLRVTICLGEPMLAALVAMSDNLATSDYHEIRENLGLTSGSHSVSLRFHFFTDLYRQLWDVVCAELRRNRAADDNAMIERVILEVDLGRNVDPTKWMHHLLVAQCFSLRAFIFQWRDEHLNMPRNNLGGFSTKSLTGSPDALAAVLKMRRAARQSDPITPLARTRGVRVHPDTEAEGPLCHYFASESSLDTVLLASTGRITQARFTDVQERLGFFANRCPFTAPPTRRA